MVQKERLIFIALAIILVTAFSSATFAQTSGKVTSETRTSELKGLLNSLEGVPHEPPRVFKTKEGYLRFIGSAPSTHFAAEPSKRGTPEQAASAFLERWRNLFVNESESIDFQKIRVKTQNSHSYVRYKQRYGGLEVFGAEMIVQVNSSGGIEAVISDIMRDTGVLDTKKVSLNPGIDASTAQKKGIEFLSEQYEKLEFEASAAALMIYSPEVAGNSGALRLVWQMQVVNVGEPLVKESVFIDAQSGEIAFHYPLIYTAMEREIWDYEGRDYNPVRKYPPTGIPDVDQAYDYLEDTYYFYFYYHGRDSYNGNGAVLEARVRYDAEEDAIWLETFMRIGPNYSVDEVIAHEFTHGVTQHESNLVYANESGAINESFSDMWGEWVDQTNGAGDDAPVVKWKIGEDTWGPIFGDGPFRSMNNPPDFDCPDRYQGSFWHPPAENPSPENDWGGVHTNSGVGNKLCYLLTDGDSFNGHTVYGMGIEKTADLFYECQIGMIPQACDYYDLYNVITQAAKTLGMTWEERVNIEEACQAVEIANDPLVHWWKFDDGSGTIAHDSVGDNDGFFSGNPTWVGGASARTGDYALDFDGDDCVSLSSISALEYNNVTVSAWVKADSECLQDEYSPIITQWYYDGQGNHGYYLCLNYGKPTFYLHDFDAPQSSTPIESNKWYHIAGTYDSFDLKIYVNGTEKDSKPLFHKTGVNTNAFIGFDGDTINGYGHFQGIIDDVRVYRWGVDVDEILDKMFYGTSKFCVKNGSGVRVAWFDDLGNLFLKGTKQTVWQEPSNQTDEFIVKRSDGVPMAYINDSGNLFLQGTFSEGQTPVPSDADEFRVQDSTGADVAIIDTTNGDIKIKGKLYQQNP